MPRSKVKDGFNRRWFMHPQWKKANVMCINACGVGLYDAWDYTRGCYTDGSWMSPSKIAKVIIDVVVDKKRMSFQLNEKRKIDHKMLNLMRNEENIDVF